MNQTISKPAYVSITDGTTAAGVLSLGNLQVALGDGLGVAITSTLVGADQALDVNVVQTATVVTDIDDDSIAANQTTELVIPLTYHFSTDTSAWERLEGAGGAANVNVINTPDVSVTSGATDIVAVEATLSGAPPDAIGGAVAIKWIIFRANVNNGADVYYGHNGGGAVMGLTPAESSNVIDVAGGGTLADFEIDGTTGDKVQYIYGV